MNSPPSNTMQPPVVLLVLESARLRETALAVVQRLCPPDWAVHSCDSAAAGQDAVAALSPDGPPLALLLAEQFYAAARGEELVAAAAERRPDALFLLTAGTPDAAAELLRRAPVFRLLSGAPDEAELRPALEAAVQLAARRWEDARAAAVFEQTAKALDEAADLDDPAAAPRRLTERIAAITGAEAAFLVTDAGGKLRVAAAAAAPAHKAAFDARRAAPGFEDEALARVTETMQADAPAPWTLAASAGAPGTPPTYLYVENPDGKTPFAEAHRCALEQAVAFCSATAARVTAERTAHARAVRLAEAREQDDARQMTLELYGRLAQMGEGFARAIQRSILPDENDLRRNFPQSFVISHTSRTVSRQFCWFSEKYHKFVGGVLEGRESSGAAGYVTLIAGTFLNQILHEGVLDADAILRKLNEMLLNHIHSDDPRVREALQLNVSLFSVDPDFHELQFAGALQQALLVRRKQPMYYRGDPTPVGQAPGATFTQHATLLEPGDWLYLFNAGLPAAFSPDAANPTPLPLADLLVAAGDDPAMQAQALRSRFEAWAAPEGAQVDDMTVLGVRFSGGN